MTIWGSICLIYYGPKGCMTCERMHKKGKKLESTKKALRSLAHSCAVVGLTLSSAAAAATSAAAALAPATLQARILLARRPCSCSYEQSTCVPHVRQALDSLRRTSCASAQALSCRAALTLTGLDDWPDLQTAKTAQILRTRSASHETFYIKLREQPGITFGLAGSPR